MVIYINWFWKDYNLWLPPKILKNVVADVGEEKKVNLGKTLFPNYPEKDL